MVKSCTSLAQSKSRKLANFSYSKLVIIESLGKGEVSTGRELAKYVSSLDSYVELQLSLEIVDCQSAQSLKDSLVELTNETKERELVPLLHIECHGTYKGDGLSLANGDEIRWTELAPLIEELNLATKFNLLLFLAACNAFYFIEEMSAIRPSPVYAVVAPSDEIDPAEVMRGTRGYYRKLFDSGDAGIALNVLRGDKLSCGKWYGINAEEWFEKTIISYVQTHCSVKIIAERARQLYQSKKSTPQRRSVGSFKRGLHQQHETFVQGYFDKYFQTGLIPANLVRFSALRKRVELNVRNILTSPGFRS